MMCFCFSFFISCEKEEDEEKTDLCVDYSGKVYKTVVIGNQLWMAENLATRFLSNGAPIYKPLQILHYPNKNVPVYYPYNNEDTYMNIYGCMYNRFCLYEGTLAPTGWRIPTKQDVEILVNFIKSKNYSFEPSDTSDWVGKALASTTIWNNNNQVGTIGNNRGVNNASGFNALPGGYYYSDNVFFGEKSVSQFWTTTVDSTTNLLQIATLQSESNDLIFTSIEGDNAAYYVRCVRDLPFSNPGKE